MNELRVLSAFLACVLVGLAFTTLSSRFGRRPGKRTGNKVNIGSILMFWGSIGFILMAIGTPFTLDAPIPVRVAIFLVVVAGLVVFVVRWKTGSWAFIPFARRRD